MASSFSSSSSSGTLLTLKQCVVEMLMPLLRSYIRRPTQMYWDRIIEDPFGRPHWEPEVNQENMMLAVRSWLEDKADSSEISNFITTQASHVNQQLNTAVESTGLIVVESANYLVSQSLDAFDLLCEESFEALVGGEPTHKQKGVWALIMMLFAAITFLFMVTSITKSVKPRSQPASEGFPGKDKNATISPYIRDEILQLAILLMKAIDNLPASRV